MKHIIEDIVKIIKHDLRNVRGETLYATAKATGLRIEIIQNLESEPMRGKAESLAIYIDNWCSRFPNKAYHTFEDAAMSAGQGKKLFE